MIITSKSVQQKYTFVSVFPVHSRFKVLLACKMDHDKVSCVMLLYQITFSDNFFEWRLA